MSSALNISVWSALDDQGRALALRRPAQRDATALNQRTALIVDDVRTRGDAALREMTARFDGVELASLAVSAEEFESAERSLTVAQIAAIRRAIGTITAFHEAQVLPPLRVETSPGVICERRMVPLQAVGLYVPAGTAPLPSTALMLAIPARIAGCPLRIMCTPPRPDGSADPAVLTVARECGVERVFKVGGAQAIAAMAYGTASIPRSTRSLARATRGSQPPNNWLRQMPSVRRSICLRVPPKCWSSQMTRRIRSSLPPICWLRQNTVSMLRSFC
jgi:histidinol dehydrogenase